MRWRREAYVAAIGKAMHIHRRDAEAQRGQKGRYGTMLGEAIVQGWYAGLSVFY